MVIRKPTILWIDRRPYVELELTEEAAHLIFLMVNAPQNAWKKEHWHPASKENADRIAGTEIAKISRWLNDRVFGKVALRVGPEAKALATSTIERLQKAYDGDGPVKEGGIDIPREQYREIAWSSVRALFERPIVNKKVILGKRLVERLQDLVKHYRGKPIEGNMSLTTHFADLENALDGKPVVTADMAELDE